jgi:hypothetical protein
MTEDNKNDVVVEEATATKKTTRKTAAKPAVEQVVAETKSARKYEPGDMIMCHSVFPGRYFFSGPKTKVVYPFEASGDETPVEYQDLQSAMMAKKKSIMAPYIVIDDEELLEDPRWKNVKKVYDTMFVIKDMDKLLSEPFDSFKKNFEVLPIGAKRKVMMEISSRVRDGEFSEMNKIRLVDEACNSNIAVLLQR